MATIYKNKSNTYAGILERAEVGPIQCETFCKYFNPCEDDDNQDIQYDRGNWNELLDKTQEFADAQGTQSYQHIWAVVDGEGSNLIVLNGRHACNVLHHIVCETPWGDGTNDDKDVYIEARY